MMGERRAEDRATWDDFHMYNIAGKRAFDKSAMATKYFALLKKLEYLFSSGQGRHLHRCVSAFLQQGHLRLAAMCGHRKMGYFAGVPQRFFETYESVYNAFLLRERHALAGRGSYSFTECKEVGEIFADTQLLVWAFALHGELHRAVQPINDRTQDASDLPWERWRAFKASCQSHQAVVSSLATLRMWLRVLVLIAPYIADNGPVLRRFWFAYCASPACGAFHDGGRWHAAAHIFAILFTGKFQNCDLSLRVKPADGKSHRTHAACQCATRPLDARLMPTISADETRAWPWKRPPLVPRDVVARDVVVPWWVKRSQCAPASFVSDGYNSNAVAVLPRWQVLPTASTTVRLQQRACRAPAMVCEALTEIDAGIVHAQAFWKDFKNEVGDYCLKDVGVSRHMQEIYEAMSVAFWLLDVVSQPEPSERHHKAAATLYGHVRADLKRLPWPPAEYGMTPNIQRWPNAEGLRVYYARWWKTIHAAARKPESRYRLAWRREAAFTVVPVRATLALRGLVVQGLLRRTARPSQIALHWPRDLRLLMHKLLSDLQVFTIGLDEPFSVRASELRQGTGRQCVATIRTPRLRGRVVRIVGRAWEWDTRRITASLEQDAHFAAGCYHMNSFFCLCRRFGKTSSACERWGHDFKYLWDTEMGPTTTTLIRRLRARLGGLRGDGTDEQLLRRTAAALMHGQRSSRDTKFRVLTAWRERRWKVAARKPQNMFTPGPETSATAESNAPFRRAEKAPGDGRKKYEPTEPEVGDQMFLERMRRRQAATMPFFADTKKQWDDDLNRTTRDRLTSERAAAYLASRPPGDLAKPSKDALNSDCSSSSSSSTSSSSSSSALEAASAERPSVGSEVASATGTGSAAHPAAGVDSSWVRPPGGKLHWCVEIDAHKSAALCRPQRTLAPDSRRGKGAAAAEATGAQWCKRCLAM